MDTMGNQITPRQFGKFFGLVGQNGTQGHHFQELLELGVFADVLNPEADLSNREAIRAAMGLDSLDTPAGLVQRVGKLERLPAHDRFVAREALAGPNRAIPIGILNESFTRDFLGVVEKNVKMATVAKRKLLKTATDQSFIDVVGGDHKAQMMLAHIVDFLKVADPRLGYFIFRALDVRGKMKWITAGYSRGEVPSEDGWTFASHEKHNYSGRATCCMVSP